MREQMLEKLRKECISAVTDRYPGEERVVVFGEGRADARILLVGEAPGEKETKCIKPFVGQAGKNLDDFLHVLEIKREDIYITNVVKFRPFKVNRKTGRLSNRPPSRDEIELCLPYINGEIGIVKPEIVVTLGNTPLQSLTGDRGNLIGKCHGIPFKNGGYYIFPLYHPASVIYNRALRETYYDDLAKLKIFIGDSNK